MGRLIQIVLFCTVGLAAFLIGILLAALRYLLTGKGAEDLTFEAMPYILDGDTLAFDGDLSIRLYGMDAPEMDHPEGVLAKRHLEHLIGGKPVKVVFVEEDKYGRGIGKVTSASGEDLSARMVADGYARAYASFTSSYVKLEKQAKKAKRGLWAQNGLAIHPELWRKAQR